MQIKLTLRSESTIKKFYNIIIINFAYSIGRSYDTTQHVPILNFSPILLENQFRFPLKHFLNLQVPVTKQLKEEVSRWTWIGEDENS